MTGTVCALSPSRPAPTRFIAKPIFSLQYPSPAARWSDPRAAIRAECILKRTFYHRLNFLEMISVNPEQARYAALYEAQHQGDYAAGYGHSNHGRAALDLLKGARSVLDVGCGHNEFVQALRDRKQLALGVDFACSSADLVCDALDMPFSNKAFEYVTAFDMLEHLRPEQVGGALKEMSRISAKFIFTIAHRASVHAAPDGGNLHPTVWPESQWKSTLEEYATGVKCVKGLWTGVWKESLDG